MSIFIGEHIVTREFLGLSLLPVVDDTPEQREEQRGTDVEDGDSQEKGVTHTSATLVKYWKVEKSRNLRGMEEGGGGRREKEGIRKRRGRKAGVEEEGIPGELNITLIHTYLGLQSLGLEDQLNLSQESDKRSRGWGKLEEIQLREGL